MKKDDLKRAMAEKGYTPAKLARKVKIVSELTVKIILGGDDNVTHPKIAAAIGRALKLKLSDVLTMVHETRRGEAEMYFRDPNWKKPETAYPYGRNGL